MPRSLTACVAIVVLLNFLAIVGSAQTVPPDTLKAEPDQTDEAYRQCVSGLRQIDAAVAVLDSLIAVDTDSRDEIALGRVEATERFEEIQGLLVEIGGLWPDLAPVPDRADSVQAVAVQHLVAHFDLQNRTLTRIYDRTTELWATRADVPDNERSDFESRVDTELQLLDRVLGWLLDTADGAELLEYDAGPVWQETDPILADFAQNLGRRVQLAVQEREEAGTHLTVAKAADAGDEEVGRRRLNVQVAAQRLQVSVEALRRTIRRLEHRSIDASPYRQIVVEATGEISEQLLDPEVLKGLAVTKWNALLDWLERRGPTVVVRALTVLAIALLFRWTARLLWMLVLFKPVQRSSRMLRDMVGRMLIPTSTVLGLLVGLMVLGVNPTTLLASVGVISVILGLALQESLGNLAAGAFIIVYRPYDLDDTVMIGNEVGQVKAMGMANTTIVTFDNRRLFVPNRKIWSEVIENRSMERNRRTDKSVRIAYGQDIEQVMKVIREALAANEIVLDDPEPSLFVAELAESWIEIAVRPWSTTADWWELYTSLPRLLIETLDANGIAVPYERRDVFMHGSSGQQGSPPGPAQPRGGSPAG